MAQTEEQCSVSNIVHVTGASQYFYRVFLHFCILDLCFFVVTLFKEGTT